MRKLIIFLLAIVSACSQETPENFILINGGTFINTKSNYYKKNITIFPFYICKYEVTQKEWKEIMGNNPSEFKGDNLPVEMVDWYECIEYCNKRSIKEGLKPYYIIDKNNKDDRNNNGFDSIKWSVKVNFDGNGYRLPTEMEWEYAAGGGQISNNFTYSGSDNADDVAWYWRNSGDRTLTGDWFWSAIENNHCKTKPVGCKNPNELGLFDMSGNVREWCWEWHESAGPDDFPGRVWKGGGWMGGEQCCEPSFSSYLGANGKGPDQGFRVCLNR